MDEEGMDKYAVEVDDEKTKTAGKGNTCPGCGGPLTKKGNVPHCANCGTEPFEKNPDE